MVNVTDPFIMSVGLKVYKGFTLLILSNEPVPVEVQVIEVVLVAVASTW